MTETETPALRVLLVEDSPGDARLIQEALADDPRWPVALDHRETLHEALESLAAIEPEMILLDLNLPDSSGVTTLESVFGAAAGIPVLVLTGSDDVDIAAACVDAGAEEYLVKGVDHHGIAKTLHLSHRRNAARKQVEDLQDSLRQILTNSSDAMVVVDAKGRTSFRNPSAERLFGAGLVQGELFGIPVVKTQVLEIDVVSEGGAKRVVEMIADDTPWMGEQGYVLTFRDVTARVEAKREVDRLNASLQQALDEVKSLRGLLPICSYCKRIRDDRDYWHSVEGYVSRHSEAEFSHSICPTCMEEHFPEDFWDDDDS